MSLQRLARFVPVVVLTTFLLLLVLIYTGGDVQAYYRLLRYTGMRPYLTPFLDTDTVMSAARCLHNGVDAYLVNPCDPLWRPYDYSPIYMGLSYLPVTQAWLVPIGISLNILFLGALLLLPLPAYRKGVVLMTLGVFSTTSLFALERGNNELIIFSLAALGAWAISRGRVWGYGAIVIAGLLKYFPLLAMAAALREKPGRLFTLAALSVAVVGLFMLAEWNELTRSLANYPWLSPYSETFGSINAAEGLTRKFRWARGVQLAILIAMIAASLAIAVKLAAQSRTSAALDQLTEPQRSFLLVGCLMTIGCFFASRNIDYRGIHLLLALPALIAFRQQQACPRWLRSSALMLLLLMWSGFWLMHIDFIARGVGSPLGWHLNFWLGWFGRELLWWWMITILLALSGNLLLRAETTLWSLQALRGGKAGRG